MDNLKLQEAKRFIYENKLFTDLTWEQARIVPMIRFGKPVSMKMKKIIFDDYKEDESMDLMRLVRKSLFGINAGFNPKTNLTII